MPDWDCCSPDAPCSEGEGDCEVDADCQGSLRCGYNNCGDNDPTGVMDCCTPQVSCKSGSSWMAWHCCTEDQPCGFKEGDCNTDSECEGDLVCGQDNCVAVGREDSHWRMDCCVPPGFTVPEPEPNAFLETTTDPDSSAEPEYEPETSAEPDTIWEPETTPETFTTTEPEPTTEPGTTEDANTSSEPEPTAELSPT